MIAASSLPRVQVSSRGFSRVTTKHIHSQHIMFISMNRSFASCYITLLQRLALLRFPSRAQKLTFLDQSFFHFVRAFVGQLRRQHPVRMRPRKIAIEHDGKVHQVIAPRVTHLLPQDSKTIHKHSLQENNQTSHNICNPKDFVTGPCSNGSSDGEERQVKHCQETDEMNVKERKRQILNFQCGTNACREILVWLTNSDTRLCTIHPRTTYLRTIVSRRK